MRFPLYKTDSTGDQQLLSGYQCFLRESPFDENTITGTESDDALGYYDFDDNDIEADVRYQMWAGTTENNAEFVPAFSDESGKKIVTLIDNSVYDPEDSDEGDVPQTQTVGGNKVLVPVPVTDIKGYKELAVRVTQTGTNAPVIAYQINTTGKTFNSVYTDVGYFEVTPIQSGTIGTPIEIYKTSRLYYDENLDAIQSLGNIVIQSTTNGSILIVTSDEDGNRANGVLQDGSPLGANNYCFQIFYF